MTWQKVSRLSLGKKLDAIEVKAFNDLGSWGSLKWLAFDGDLKRIKTEGKPWNSFDLKIISRVDTLGKKFCWLRFSLENWKISSNFVIISQELCWKEAWKDVLQLVLTVHPLKLLKFLKLSTNFKFFSNFLCKNFFARHGHFEVIKTTEFCSFPECPFLEVPSICQFPTNFRS